MSAPDLVVSLVAEWRQRSLVDHRDKPLVPGITGEELDGIDTRNGKRMNELVDLIAGTVATSAEGLIGQVRILREIFQERDHCMATPELLAGFTGSITVGIYRIAGGAA
jgi:hypothetical protein